MSEQWAGFTFDHLRMEWRSHHIKPRAERLPPLAYEANSSLFWISWAQRDSFADTNSKDPFELNAQLSVQLNTVDVCNTISLPGDAEEFLDTLHVIEFNIMRGSKWSEAVNLIRKTGDPDIVLINEADW